VPSIVSDSATIRQLTDGGRIHDAVVFGDSKRHDGDIDFTIELARAIRLVGDIDRATRLLGSLADTKRVSADQQWRHDFELACLTAQQGDFAGASALYQSLLKREPDHPRCLANLYRIACHVCNFPVQDRLRQQLAALSGNIDQPKDLAAAEAIYTFELVDDSAQNLAVNKLRAKNLRPVQVQRLTAGKQSGAPWRIGYLGEPFRNHARAHLLTGVLEHHDRQQFEIFAYCTGRDDGSDVRRRFEAAVDTFRQMQGKTDQALVQMIAEDGLDILVATDGWNHQNRMAVLAGKPAPIQIGYLGNPCTSGTDFIDYMIVDDVIAPEGDEEWFTERLIRLPDTYQATDNRQVKPAIIDRALLRQQHGLPADALVFASLNQPYKLNREILELWFGIIRSVPGSVLWLLDGHPQARANLQQSAQLVGVDPQRLVFAPFASKPDHITRLTAADIGLDPLICNGHTTTTDALWAGVPVVALYGRHFASRVAASLLHAAGLPEMVVQNRVDYAALARSLAFDPERRRQLNLRLIEGRDHNRLFDTAGRTRALEAAYRQVLTDRNNQMS
jgi:protein O-GlcNAc transferase